MSSLHHFPPLYGRRAAGPGPTGPYRLQVFEYTGDGSANRVIPLNAALDPDLAVVRSKFTTQASYYRVKPGLGGQTGDWHGPSESSPLGEMQGIVTDGIIDMGAGYITVGNGAYANADGVDYTGYAWEELPGANAALVMGGYDGDGNYPKSVAGVGFQPTMVVVYQDTFAAEGDVFNVPDSSLTIPFGTRARVANLLLDSDGFTLSRSGYNEPGSRYLWMAWRDVPDVCGYVQLDVQANSTVATDPGVVCDLVWHSRRAADNMRAWFRTNNFFSGGTPYATQVLQSSSRSDALQDFVSGGYDVGSYVHVVSWVGGFWWTEQGLS